MEQQGIGIIIQIRPFGNTSAIVRIFSQHHGITAILAKGGYSKKMQTILQLGNLISFSVKKRLESHLGSGTIELTKSYGTLCVSDKTKCLINVTLCEILNILMQEDDPQTQCYNDIMEFYCYMTECMHSVEICKAYALCENKIFKTCGMSDKYGAQTNLDLLRTVASERNMKIQFREMLQRHLP